VDENEKQSLEVSIAGEMQKINALVAEQNQCVQEMSREITKRQFLATKRKAETKMEVLKLAVSEVADFQVEVVAKSMEAILGDASLFCDGIIKGKLAWVDGELGLIRNGKFISHEVFSGTESAVAYIGIAVALSQSSQFKLVLMDELGVVDSNNIEKLMERIEQMIASGMIHQFVGCDVRPERYKAKSGVNLITI